MQSFLVWSLLLLAISQMSDACSCLRSHYQTLFCRADAVVQGTILSKSFIYSEPAITNNEVFSSSDDSTIDMVQVPEMPQYPHRYPLYVVYNMSLSRVYKGEDQFLGLDTVSVTSAANGAMCGVSHLQEGETYVLSGFVWDGEINIGLCSSWVEPVKSLSAYQKRGLKRLYARTCDDCQVCNPMYDRCTQDDGCQMSFYESQCFMQNSLCTRASNGKCQWKKNKYIKLC